MKSDKVMLFILVIILGLLGVLLYGSEKMREMFEGGRVLVSYAYYEKNTPRHNKNLEFFLKEGYERFRNFKNVDIYLCLNGGKCNVNLPDETENFKIVRRGNTGFDFGAHEDVLNIVISKYGSLDKSPYSTYVFLNGSQRGPFLPVYWRPDVHWSTVFSDKFKTAGLVGSCKFFNVKDKIDTVETWAFALRPDALKIAIDNGTIFRQHPTKESACVAEDDLTRVILNSKLGIDTLQLKFARDKSSKNNYKISSRPWSYENISINPLETVFYKTYWDTALNSENGYDCPFEQRYTEWILGGNKEYETDVFPLYKLWNNKLVKIISNINK